MTLIGRLLTLGVVCVSLAACGLAAKSEALSADSSTVPAATEAEVPAATETEAPAATVTSTPAETVTDVVTPAAAETVVAAASQADSTSSTATQPSEPVFLGSCGWYFNTFWLDGWYCHEVFGDPARAASLVRGYLDCPTAYAPRRCDGDISASNVCEYNVPYKDSTTLFVRTYHNGNDEHPERNQERCNFAHTWWWFANPDELVPWDEKPGVFTAITNECATYPDHMPKERVRYRTNRVAFGESCEAETQERYCDSTGTVAWSGTFKNFDCEVAPDPLGCSPEGASESRERYQDEYTDKICQKETQNRQCTNRRWTPWSGSFTSETCAVKRSCDGVTHGRWQSRNAYAAPSGDCYPASVESRTCNDGTWSSWQGSGLVYAPYTECVVKARCYNGDSTTSFERAGDQQQRTRYLKASIAGTETCQPETQTRTCQDDGKWTAWSGTYDFEDCKGMADLKYHASCSYGGLCFQFFGDGLGGRGPCPLMDGCDYLLREERYGGPGECEIIAYVPLGSNNALAASLGVKNGWGRYVGMNIVYNSTHKDAWAREHCNVSGGAFIKASDCDGVPSGGVQVRERLTYETSFYNPGKCIAEEQTRLCNNGSWERWVPDRAPYEACTEVTP